ncbi:hypothetical protein ABZ128_09565 [Streptomyces sp. NPDC006326]|uniref:deoxynucleotide monophosphate kinase family protein n=1 Tax=Streptomyces sp. NPDC006326 TaxID=3156752 RepID=UPI0033A05C4F
MNIGIIGRARSGKDTAGQWLVDNRGYERVAFADPLKAAALKLDPIVGVERAGTDDRNVSLTVRLSDYVVMRGWEAAKEVPEVRRTLQELGASMRAVDPEVWLRAGLARAYEVNRNFGRPAVITDVRYLNEAVSLKNAGFKLIHIDRPGVPHLEHESEGALGPEDAHFMIRNDGNLTAFWARLELIADEITALESARHYARSHS